MKKAKLYFAIILNAIALIISILTTLIIIDDSAFSFVIYRPFTFFIVVSTLEIIDFENLAFALCVSFCYTIIQFILCVISLVISVIKKEPKKLFKINIIISHLVLASIIVFYIYAIYST